MVNGYAPQTVIRVNKALGTAMTSFVVKIGLSPHPPAIGKPSFAVSENIAAEAFSDKIFGIPKVFPWPPAHLLSLLLGNEFPGQSLITRLVECLQNADELLLIDFRNEGLIEFSDHRLAAIRFKRLSVSGRADTRKQNDEEKYAEVSPVSH